MTPETAKAIAEGMISVMREVAHENCSPVVAAEAKARAAEAYAGAVQSIVVTGCKKES